MGFKTQWVLNVLIYHRKTKMLNTKYFFLFLFPSTQLECQPFTYGSNCTQPCTCKQSNTQYCNSTTGQCVCKPGWTSTDCSADLDECFENPLSCPDYSTCTNTIGSFQCTCKEGLVMNEGQCKCKFYFMK